MGNGFGIAALIVLVLSLGVPIFGNFITLIALAFSALSALGRSKVWPIAIVAAAGVKLFFLSPSWMILMAGDPTFLWITIAALAVPILCMFFAPRRSADRTARESRNLERPADAPGLDTDVRDWDRVLNKDDPDQLQEYLLRHPSGRFAELARMKLERLGVAPIASLAAAPSVEPSEQTASDDRLQSLEPSEPAPTLAVPGSEAPRRQPSRVLVILGGIVGVVALLGAGYLGFNYLRTSAPEAAVGASPADQFVVLPYEAGEQLHARESGSRYRELPFARPDIRILGETNEREPLSVTGWVDQPDGHWYQVRLADGRTAYLKASLTVSATTLARESASEPPLTNGVYVQRGVCPFEGCVYRQWRAERSTSVYAEPEAGAATIGRVRPGEWVRAQTGEVHITPVRGRAIRASGDVSVGDVGYRLSYLGEGNWSVWHNGRVLDDSSVFEFSAGDDADRGAWWVRISWANGRQGWIRDANNFACRGLFGGDEGCLE